MMASTASTSADLRVEEEADDDSDAEAEAATERLMLAMQKGFETAKRTGVPCATRLCKELMAVCAAGASFEVTLIGDNLQQWEIALYDWAFDESSALHKDLKALSEEADDVVPLLVRIHFPDDFPFQPPLVYCSSPELLSEYIFDGGACQDCAALWQPRSRRRVKLTTARFASQLYAWRCSSTGSPPTATWKPSWCRSLPSCRRQMHASRRERQVAELLWLRPPRAQSRLRMRPRSARRRVSPMTI